MKIITSLRGKRGTMAQPGGQSPETHAGDSLVSVALRIMFFIFCVSIISFLSACKNKNEDKNLRATADSSLINTKHLDHLYIPVTFLDSVKAAGIYIYAEAPNYYLVADSDEGFTCVDDVSRAALVYLRSKSFSIDTAIQNKAFNLLRFILEMQSENGYFYNFLFPDNTINKKGNTSINTPNWWSWRALQTLTEASPIVKEMNAPLAKKIDTAINKLVIKIKNELISLPRNTKVVKGITVPQWLPAGSATDQASILILSLINYCTEHDDSEVRNFIRKLADGIIMMQQGDETHFPYSCFLSWENVWHAYGCDQSYALMKAGKFLNDSNYIKKAFAEVDTFYPWLLKNGMRSSFSIIKEEKEFVIVDEKIFSQIAYDIRPMIFAATEAYEVTGKQKYADIAAQLAAWFFGANAANEIMYDKNTGRCFDGIIVDNKLNKNSGAESTIECLLALQKIEDYPAIIVALDKYKK